MSKIVADASVVVKWLLPEQPEEPDIPQALALFEHIMEGAIQLIQPPHWLAETGAVLARLAPNLAEDYMGDLLTMEIPVADSPAVYQRGTKLACQLSHHLFDTLYHAVALETDDTVLVTADVRYYRKSSREGDIQLLQNWRRK
ncbi:MAG: type II toxin-antitoxin system VapC family toxin [Gammaproteobacteria bacterium]